MKNILAVDKPIGDGKLIGAFGVEGDQLKAEVAVTYPIAKIIEPATKAVDAMLDKLEAAIPGDWDKPFVAAIKVEFEKDLIKMLSE
jgi:hypothetical protein